MKTIFLLCVAFVVSMSVSCTRASKSEVSSLKFDFSKVSQKNGGIIPQSAIPAGSEICYGVNVVASDLPSKKDKCSPQLGVFAGFISEAKELSLEVPFGKDREVQLYAYLPKAGSACLDANQTNNGLDPQSIYLVGKVSNVVFDQPVTTLAMPVSFPGVAHSIYADLGMDASCLKSGGTAPPQVVDPNAPVVLNTTLNTSSITSSGVDEYITLYMLIKSNSPVNFLTLSHDGPNGNISGGGSSHMFYACTIGNIGTAGHICETGTVSNYYAQKTISVSQWAQNGTYSLNLSVTNSAGLASAIVQAPTYTITNHPVVAAPILTSVTLAPDASLTSGAGGNVEVIFIAQSSVAPDFIEKSLRRPDMGFVSGGGSAASFLNCSAYTASVGHPCYGLNSSFWYFSVYDTLNAFQQNGTYNYINIRVRNMAGLYSSIYGSTPSFVVSGNIAASTPVIQSVEGFYAFDNDPFTFGIPFYASSCIRPEGTNLATGLRVKSTSNADINWMNYTFQGPNSVLMGGGNTVSSADLGGGNWESIMSGTIGSVTFAPSGIYAWNGLSVKNLGDLTSTSVNGPSLNLQNSCPTTYVGLSISNGISCGITNTNKLECWGPNNYNAIDHGSTTVPRKYPTVVDGNVNYLSISRGGTHTCGITLTNSLRCWGGNSYYELGNGTSTASAYPITIDSGTPYSKVAAGLNHTCGITGSGVLKCWGKNAYGQLGDGTTTNKSLPTIIDSGTQYQSIDAGETHTCGITFAGVLKCWGFNSNGQIGDGTTTQKTSPTVINSGVNYMSVEAGSLNTCAVTTTNTLKCWGFNGVGQVGDGSTTQRTSPVIVDSGVLYSKVSIRSSHTCGILTSGLLKCWGTNMYGQLGDGTVTNRSVPTLTSGGYMFSYIAVDQNHSCGITLSGQMKCWGQNTSFELGNGTMTGTNVPVDIN